MSSSRLRDDVSDSASNSPSESEDGWKDVDADSDEESVALQCFWADATLDSPAELLQHLKEKHDFGFHGYARAKKLDFYGAIKLVNFLRSSQKSTGAIPEQAEWNFEDDKFMQPVQEDDAVLTALDELLPAEDAEISDSRGKNVDQQSSQTEFEDLKRQFEEYKALVEQSLSQRLATVDETSSNAPQADSNDDNYFVSYAYNEIHETMLKDSIRTDSYRDFIYNNKHIFSGKTVLDVGCGTGILSMFSARAGAGKVFAVDNSAILDKAREIIYSNQLDKTISCVKGKIEEVVLPGSDGQKVDVIVSEWMGYTLLYEAMLSSVLKARDRYLAPDGLMAPSHCTILLAPICDEDLVLDTYSFWNDVYGFNMSAMKEKIFEDVLIRHLPDTSLAGAAVRVHTLDLHTITDAELPFETDFELALHDSADTLDGFLLYFDTFFLQSRTAKLDDDARADRWPKDEGTVAFSTGPGPREKETHWRQGLCLLEPGKDGNRLEKGSGRRVRGHIKYEMNKLRPREVDIEIRWRIGDGTEERNQKWKLS